MPKSKLYRKKPVVISAYQTHKEMDIETLEGVMHASVGDYIITGVNGEKYPCKPDIFAATYEPIRAKKEKKKRNIKYVRYIVFVGELNQQMIDENLNELVQKELANYISRPKSHKLSNKLVKDIEWRINKHIFSDEDKAEAYLKRAQKFEPTKSIAVRYYHPFFASDNATMQRELRELIAARNELQSKYNERVANTKLKSSAAAAILKTLNNKISSIKHEIREQDIAWLIYVNFDINNLE